MTEIKTTSIDTTTQIKALRSAISLYKSAAKDGSTRGTDEWRGNRLNERRLAYLTGEVFYGVRVFDLDVGKVQPDGIQAMGASREVARNVICALEVSLAAGHRIKIASMSRDFILSLTLCVGDQITLEVHDREKMRRVEVTFHVFLTASQAEAWVKHQKKLGAKHH